MARAVISFGAARVHKRPPSPSPCEPSIDLGRVRDIVARTRAEQGLSPTGTDPAVMAKLATLSAAVTTRHPALDNSEAKR